MSCTVPSAAVSPSTPTSFLISVQDLIEMIKEGRPSFAEPVWAKVSPQARDLLEQILVTEPDRRLFPIKALQHPWFASYPSEHSKSETNSVDTNESDENSVLQLELIRRTSRLTKKSTQEELNSERGFPIAARKSSRSQMDTEFQGLVLRRVASQKLISQIPQSS